MSVPAGDLINLLLFSVGGVHFGCDAKQAETMDAYLGEAADDLCWFHEELGYGGRPVSYNAPSVVTVRTADFRSLRVIIDLVEDLVEISAADISPLPLLLEPLLLPKGMWGVVQRDGRMILLVDFQRFLKRQMRLERPGQGGQR